MEQIVAVAAPLCAIRTAMTPSAGIHAHTRCSTHMHARTHSLDVERWSVQRKADRAAARGAETNRKTDIR